MTLDWGTVPAWIGALVTGGALIGTTRLLFIERSRRKTEIEEKREEIASGVTHWLVTLDNGLTAPAWGLYFSNQSGTPVFQVELHLYFDGDYLAKTEIARVPPTSAEGLTIPRVNAWLQEHLGSTDKKGSQIRLDLLFTDARGMNWARDLNGLLVALEKRRLKEGIEWLHRYKLEEDSGPSSNDGSVLGRFADYAARNRR